MIKVKQFIGQSDDQINDWISQQKNTKFVSFHQSMMESKGNDDKPRVCVLMTIVYDDNITGGMRSE